MAVTPRPRLTGRFTLQSTGILFLLSGLYELASLTSPVWLFGGMRSGAAAAAYHGFYLLVFTAMGVGLWTLRRWGRFALYAGTALYSADKLLWLSDPSGQEASARDLFRKILDNPLLRGMDVSGVIDPGQIRDMTLITSLLFLLSWWGFAFYVHFQKGLFQDGRRALPRRAGG